MSKDEWTKSDEEFALKVAKAISPTSAKCIDLIYAEATAAGLGPKGSWLFMGRVSQLIFNTHFQLGLKASEDLIRKKEEEKP